MAEQTWWNPFDGDVVPGVNVRNVGKQGADIVGLDGQFGSQTDYDLSPNYTISGREGQTAVLGINTDNSGGGSGGGGGTPDTGTVQNVTQPQTYTDSLGRTWNNYGEFQRNQDNVRRNVGVKQGGYISEAESGRRGAKNAYENDAQSVVNEIRSAQGAINTGRANNALNLRRSMASIASGIRQGLRSGRTQLANMNAGDSSAARAMAMGFARSGNKQASQVGNESQLKENEFASSQQELDRTEGQKLGALKSWRDNKVQDIGNKLFQSLQELDAQAQGEGLNGIVDMGARDRVVAQANAELNAIDKATQAELAKINGLTTGEVQQRAAEMDAAGAAVGNPFSYDGANVQFGGNGGTPAGASNSPVANRPVYRDEDGTMVTPAATPVRPQEEELVRV